MIQLALQNNCHLLCLPPHTTHRLQPLDVGVFGPLQKRWEERCDEIVSLTNASIQIQDVVREYIDVRSQALKPETIKSAWKSCGIYPLDPTVFSDDDYAPARITSTVAHVPPTYPTNGLEGSLSDDTDDSNSDSSSGSESDSQSKASNPNSDSDDSDDEDMEDCDNTSLGAGEGHTSSGAPLRDGIVGSGSAPRSPQANPSLGLGASVESPTTSTSTELPVVDNQTPSQPSRSLASVAHTQPRQRSHRTALPVPMVRGPGRVPLKQIHDLPTAIDEIRQLRAENRELRSKSSSYKAHALMMSAENGTLRGQVNKKSKKKGERIRIKASLVTAGEGLEETTKQQAERKEKKRQQAEKQQREKENADNRETIRKQRANDAQYIFEGSIKTKKKDELRDICAALNITQDGTCKLLIERLNTHLDSNPLLQSDPRFMGLFATNTTMRRRGVPLGQVPVNVTAPLVPGTTNTATNAIAGPSNHSVDAPLAPPAAAPLGLHVPQHHLAPPHAYFHQHGPIPHPFHPLHGTPVPYFPPFAPLHPSQFYNINNFVHTDPTLN